MSVDLLLRILDAEQRVNGFPLLSFSLVFLSRLLLHHPSYHVLDLSLSPSPSSSSPRSPSECVLEIQDQFSLIPLDSPKNRCKENGGDVSDDFSDGEHR